MKTLILTICLVLMALPATAQYAAPSAAIPAVAGTVEGARGTIWESDVNILNVGTVAASVVLILLPSILEDGPAFEPVESDPIVIHVGNQLTIHNVVSSLFGKVDVSGSLLVFSDGAALVVTSRTFTPGEASGSYGLAVYGIPVSGTAWISGIRQDNLFRTNVGIFLPSDPSSPVDFYVTVLNDEGYAIATRRVVFTEAGLLQRNLRFFSGGAPLTGWVEIYCSDPDLLWYAYATVIDQTTGDSTFQAATSVYSE
jgi:hypothetical protein